MNNQWPKTFARLYLKASNKDWAVYSQERPGMLRAFFQEVHIRKIVSRYNQRVFWQKQNVTGNRMGPRPEQESRIAVGIPTYFVSERELLVGAKPLTEYRLRKLAGAPA